MSPPDSNKPQGPVARFDVYTTMLLVSLLAIIAASVLLALECARYKWDYKATGARAQAAPAATWPGTFADRHLA